MFLSKITCRRLCLSMCATVVKALMTPRSNSALLSRVLVLAVDETAPDEVAIDDVRTAYRNHERGQTGIFGTILASFAQPSC